jgi:hypothetical protein
MDRSQIMRKILIGIFPIVTAALTLTVLMIPAQATPCVEKDDKLECGSLEAKDDKSEGLPIRGAEFKDDKVEAPVIDCEIKEDKNECPEVEE